ncbi:hypothetical protein A9G35_08885 [Gilliamella sp. Choc5-1]|uniref:hypothetical protein n=1 Tax=Gilliamella sp. Choc5-1 TaxID=3120238 RepID=UPI00080E6FE8|nr:hypothetical protein [Gilliamella apicola]OCG44014.1 hypothetical protein A9G35_08885 [Gilliamella apicola]
MIGFDLILEKIFSEIVLQKALSKSFGISKNSILITDDYVSYQLTDDIKIWCMVNQINGDFLSLCQFFIRDNKIEYNPKVISRRLSYTLNTKCLIPDENINPLTWIMISPDCSEKTVILDSDELDNDRYVVSKI